MAIIVLIVSIVLTAFVLVLSLVVIKKGYGYKHTIDALDDHADYKENKDDIKE